MQPARIVLGGVVLGLGLAAAACETDGASEPERAALWAGNVEVSPDNPQALRELQGVGVVTGDLSITRAESLAALSALAHVQGDLTIQDSPALKSLTGLERLTRVDGNLVIIGAKALGSLASLGALEEVGGDVQLLGLSSLEELTGLEKLERIGGDLRITSNEALADLAALSALTYVAGSIELVGNDALLSARLGLEWSEGPSIGGHVQVLHNASLRELEHFGSFDQRDGPCNLAQSDLWVSSNDRLESIILPSLVRRQPCINIFDNPRLATLAGGDTGWWDTLTLMKLPSLTKVDLHFMEVRKLDVSGTGLASLDGLGRVNCQLWVNDNPALTSLGDLGSHPGQVAEYISVTDNQSLPQCAVDALLKALPEPRILCADPVTSTARTSRVVDGKNNDSQAVCEEVSLAP